MFRQMVFWWHSDPPPQPLIGYGPAPEKYNSRGSDLNAPKFVQISIAREIQGLIQDVYKYSFYPRTKIEWNSIPPEIRKSKNVNSFKDIVIAI